VSTGVGEGSHGACGRWYVSGLGRDVGWKRSVRGSSERAGHVGCVGCAGEIKEERMLGLAVLVSAGFEL
jgi:hypothetical protein